MLYLICQIATKHMQSQDYKNFSNFPLDLNTLRAYKEFLILGYNFENQSCHKSANIQYFKCIALSVG